MPWQNEEPQLHKMCNTVIYSKKLLVLLTAWDPPLSLERNDPELQFKNLYATEVKVDILHSILKDKTELNLWTVPKFLLESVYENIKF